MASSMQADADRRAADQQARNTTYRSPLRRLSPSRRRAASPARSRPSSLPLDALPCKGLLSSLSCASARRSGRDVRPRRLPPPQQVRRHRILCSSQAPCHGEYHVPRLRKGITSNHTSASLLKPTTNMSPRPEVVLGRRIIPSVLLSPRQTLSETTLSYESQRVS